MPNILTITVETPDDVLNAGAYGAGALVRLQTAATEAGAYADVTGTGSTPTIAIVAATRSYTGFDPNGTVSSWYRTRYENVGGTRVSDWSSSFQVAPEGSGLICALWDVKQALGRASSDTSADEDILERIRDVTDEIQSYCGRWFVRQPASGTSTFLLDVPYATRELWVPVGIASLTTLEVASESQPESGGTYTTVPAADWMLRPTETMRTTGFPATRICIRDNATGSVAYFPPGYNIVRGTGARGFASVPPSVRAIGERAVVASFLSKGSGAGGVAAVGPNGGTTVLRYISPADRERLDFYAVVPV